MTKDRMVDRKRLLDAAAEAVLHQRNKQYGEPDEDFQRIAAIASAMGFRAMDRENRLVRDLNGSDVSRFMIALKLSRLSWMPGHEDSWIDIAGYAACGMETANMEDYRRVTQNPVSHKLSQITGHGYDGCPICVQVRNDNPDLVI